MPDASEGRIACIITVIRSSETSVLKRATRRNIPEDGTLHSQWREKLKSYKIIILVTLIIATHVMDLPMLQHYNE
jgi:hypothetical protein